MCKFIKIINGESYIEDLRGSTLYKYIPSKLLITIQKYIKPRVLCRYNSRKMDSQVGMGIGMYLNSDDISPDEYKAKLIDIINSLKQEGENENLEYLIDDSLKLDIEDLKEIEEKCDIKIPRGKNMFADNVLACLREICKVKNEEISRKEVFILSEDTKVTEELVMSLALVTKFISLYSEDERFSRKLETNILSQTGLPLHLSRDDSQCLDTFDFIVNLKEDADASVINKLNRKVVLDLSKTKCLAANGCKSKRANIVIEDLFFENDNDIYSENSRHSFDEFLNTSLSSLFENINNNIKKVKVNGKALNLDRALLNKKREQTISYFKKIEK